MSSRSGCTQCRSAMPSTARTTSPSKGAWIELAPCVAFLRGDADEQRRQPTGGVPVQALATVDPDEVEGVPLTEHVGPMAGDAVGRRVDRHPAFVTQREGDDDGR